MNISLGYLWFTIPSITNDLNMIYTKLSTLKKHSSDWCLAIALFLYFVLIAEQARPFLRKFSLSDPTISYPFTTNERVSSTKCILISFLVPSITVLLITVIKRANKKRESLNLIHVSQLGLILSIVLTGVITDIFKNWIARPRPDFLARCGPIPSNTPKLLVGIEVCSAPLGQAVLMDGMRSTPSGHTSIAFSGLFYLSLWMVGQLKIVASIGHQPIYKSSICLMPILLASYIGLSRTQDYRHHFSDVGLGCLIGTFFASFSYFKYFPSLKDENCDEFIGSDESKLPI